MKATAKNLKGPTSRTDQCTLTNIRKKQGLETNLDTCSHCQGLDHPSQSVSPPETLHLVTLESMKHKRYSQIHLQGLEGRQQRMRGDPAHVTQHIDV
jgi:hypothetical protein